MTDSIPEKKAEMGRALARQLRETEARPSLAGRQAEAWDRIAKLAQDEEAAR